MRVLYITPFYSQKTEASFARIHDIIYNCNKVNIEPIVIARHYSKHNKKSNSHADLVQKEGRLKFFNFINFFQAIKNTIDREKESIEAVHVVSSGITNALIPIKLLRKIGWDKKIIYGPNFPKSIKNLPKEIRKSKKLSKLIFENFIEDLCFKMPYDILMFQGKFHKEMVMKNWAPDKESFIFKASVNTDLFNPEKEPKFRKKQENNFYLGYSGGNDIVKGLPTLIESLKCLSTNRTPDIVLLLAGNIEPKYVNKIKDIHKKYDYIDVKFLGKIKRSEMPFFYNSIDFLVFPSIFETSSTTVVESLACGTPVLGSDIPPVLELVNPGKNALLFKPQDPAGLSKKIIESYQNLNSFKNYSVKNYKRYSIDEQLNILRGLYSE